MTKLSAILNNVLLPLNSYHTGRLIRHTPLLESARVMGRQINIHLSAPFYVDDSTAHKKYAFDQQPPRNICHYSRKGRCFSSKQIFNQ